MNLMKLNSIKRDQSEMEDTLTEKKNNLQGINSRVDDAENKNSDLKYKEAENTQTGEEKEKKNTENEGSVRSL